MHGIRKILSFEVGNVAAGYAAFFTEPTAIPQQLLRM
jgi:hypothetical protein